MESVEYRQVDTDYRNHLQAFLNFAVKAEKKVGKGKSVPVYKKFKKFFDYEMEIKKIKDKKKTEKEKSRFSGIGKFLNRG